MPFILDASALLVVVLRELGAGLVLDALKSGVQMSTVNIAEVASRLHREGWATSQVNAIFEELPIEIVPFDLATAMLTGRYRPQTDHLGLSLGDRACLATANLRASTAVTADRAWLELHLQGVDVQCIR